MDLVRHVTRYVASHYRVANINVNQFVTKGPAIHANSNHRLIVVVAKQKRVYLVAENVQHVSYAWNHVGK